MHTTIADDKTITSNNERPKPKLISMQSPTQMKPTSRTVAVIVVVMNRRARMNGMDRNAGRVNMIVCRTLQE